MFPTRTGWLAAVLLGLSTLGQAQQGGPAPTPGGTPPQARFRVLSQVGEVPLTVEFRDRSFGDITSWSWDFGDGGSSTEQHPTHAYDLAGTYSVTLEVSGPGGSDRKRSPDLIRAQFCDVVNARENNGFPFSLGIDYVPVVGDDSRGFHVLYSAKDNNGAGTPGNTVGMFVFELSDGDILLFGAGYGNYPGPDGALFSASYDISRLDMLLRSCLGKRPDQARIQFVSPHAHGDHLNPAAMAELRNLGWQVASIWFHEGDDALVNGMSWTALDRSVFRRVKGGVPCVDRLIEFDSTLGDLWFYVRPGHTNGALDLAIDVDGDETNRVIVRGSLASTLCNPGNVREIIDAHGNVVLRAPPPLLNNLTPARGSARGGATLTLTGNNFRAQGAARPQIFLGDAEVTEFTVVDDRTIELTSPAGDAGGLVGMRILNRNGASERDGLFTYNERPMLLALSPGSGRATGGTLVSLEGRGFLAFQAGESRVTFGGREATDVEVQSDTILVCRAPLGSPGSSVSVRVENANGVALEALDFAYGGLPGIRRVFPEIMTSLGGAEISITGHDLGVASGAPPRVWFAGREASSVTVLGEESLLAVAPPGPPGERVDVRVRTAEGDALFPQSIRYNPLPTLTSVAPSMGSHLGGTVVTARGTGFRGLRAGPAVVRLGGVLLTEFEVLGDDEVRFTTPPGTPGALLDVEVENVNGVARLAQAFAYDPVLLVEGVSSARGSSLGGQWIELYGAGFVAGGTTTVRIDGNPALEQVVLSDTHLRLRTPPGRAGVNVAFRVNNDLGIVFLQGGFRYNALPVLASVQPAAGTPLGGTRVGLQGSGFQLHDPGPTTVTFGGLSASNLTVVSDTFLTCDSPAGAAASRVDVELVNQNGAALLAGAFDYHPTPTLRTVSPSAGSSLGGTLVTVTGSGFLDQAAGVPRLVVGPSDALELEVLADDRLTFVTPPGTPGMVVGLRVFTENGSGALPGAFRFHSLPTISAITPSTVSGRRRPLITVEGSGFLQGQAGNNTVTVGLHGAAEVSVVSDTRLTFRLPDGLLGPVPVRVSNANGSAGRNPGLTVADATPTLESCFPVNGPFTGGRRVQLVGTGLEDFDPLRDAVLFGRARATDVTWTGPGVLACTTPPGEAGDRVVVSVSFPGGSAQLVNAFLYNAQPRLDGLSPASGMAAGGTPVVITGAGFFRGAPGPNLVRFGGVPATSIEVLADGSLRCLAPPGTRGDIVDVELTNANGTGRLLAAYEYTHPPPVLTDLLPRLAPATGGTLVRLQGSGFSLAGAEGNEVFFGDNVGLAVLLVGDDELQCRVPPGIVGAQVDVRVRNGNGEARLVAAFEYVAPPPVVISLEPTSTSSLGGEPITVAGTGFADSDPGTTQLVLGATTLTDFTILDDRTLVFVAPSGTPTARPALTLGNDHGSATLLQALRFHDLPGLTSLEASSGPSAGGGSLALLGSGFLTDRAGPSRVYFDDTAASGVAIADDGTLSCVVPPGLPGSTVQVRLENSNGEAAERLPYRYHAVPELATVSPPGGSSLGVTVVTITGSGFTNDVSGTTTVTFGGQPAGAVVFLDDQTLTCVAPAGTPETVVDVRLANGNGESELAGVFAYHPVPVLASITPDNGPVVGTDLVTLRGEHFMANLPGFPTITVGGRPARNILVLDDQTLTCRVPSGIVGPRDVVFSNRNGTALLAGGYFYGIPAPRIDSLDPGFGSSLGGTLLTLQGSAFAENAPGTNQVLVGGQPATGVTVLDDDHLTCLAPAGLAGATVDVQVQNSNGSAIHTAAFTYHPAPRIDAVTPAQGSTVGGLLVTLAGSGFLDNEAGPPTVSFGLRAATEVTVLADGLLTCRTPEAPGPGRADVILSHANGSAILVDGFTALAPVPTLVALTPTRGSAFGGSRATLLGSGFQRFQPGVNRVFFGAQEATAVVVAEDGSLALDVPPGMPGTVVDVVLENANGTALLPGAFRYHAAPSVVSLAPGAGPAAGGTRVVVSGSGFAAEDPGSLGLTVGGTAATELLVLDDTRLEATLPAGPAGATVDVRLTTDNGTATLPGGYRYHARPAITSLAPNEGPPQGGTLVTLQGSGFELGVVGPTRVRIGALEASSVTVLDDSTLTCEVPPAPAAGWLDVQVENSNGSGTRVASYRYRRAPSLLALDPPSGTGLGGTTVTLTGAGFTEGSASPLTVLLGGQLATGLVVVDDTTLRCVTPPSLTPGNVDVQFVSQNGSATLAGAFRFHAPPVISDFTPEQASTVSGATVTILGSGFSQDVSGPTTVLFGLEPALSVQVQSDGEIVVQAPPRGAAGTVTVLVQNANGAGVLSGAFTYHEGPVVHSLLPSSGPSNLRTRVNITGSGFSNGSAGFPTIYIGARPARNIAVLDDSNIRCDANFGVDGPADVLVVNGNGSFTLTAGFYYGDPTPQLDAVSPSSGPAGALVTLTGRGFVAPTAGLPTVQFGGLSATDVSVLDDATLSCLAPAGVVGTTVSVRVANALGNDQLASAFTFLAAPGLTVVEPAHGAAAGGSTVLVRGHGFATLGAPTVRFGGVPARGVRVLDDRTLLCELPAGAPARWVDVGLADGGVTARLGRAFRYDDGPRLTQLSPDEGSPFGGETIELSVTGLGPAVPTVHFGGRTARVLARGARSLMVRAPAGVPGTTVLVEVLSASGASNTWPFRYREAPLLTGVDPPLADSRGGVTVRLSGVALTGPDGEPASILVDGQRVEASESLPGGELLVPLPTGTNGQPAHLRVETADGHHESLGLLGWRDVVPDDVNGDGWSDALQVRTVAGRHHLAVYLAGPDGPPGELDDRLPDLWLLGSERGSPQSRAFQVGDANGDWIPDVLVGSPEEGDGRVLLYLGPFPGGVAQTIPATFELAAPPGHELHSFGHTFERLDPGQGTFGIAARSRGVADEVLWFELVQVAAGFVVRPQAATTPEPGNPRRTSAPADLETH